MKVRFNSLGMFKLLTVLTIILAFAQDAVSQSGKNGGHPIVTYNINGPLSILSQSPPSFPAGEEKLVAFILDQVETAGNYSKLPRKLWLIATIDADGNVVSLVPSDSSNASLKNEIARVGALMPKWTPGMINQKGVETLFEFLVRPY
jgi:hypothetical protein